jgi:hypothetical protein
MIRNLGRGRPGVDLQEHLFLRTGGHINGKSGKNQDSNDGKK